LKWRRRSTHSCTHSKVSALNKATNVGRKNTLSDYDQTGFDVRVTLLERLGVDDVVPDLETVFEREPVGVVVGDFD
jgi:hypothetical protein